MEWSALQNSPLVFAYSYSDPLLEAPPNWVQLGYAVDRTFQDRGDRQQLQALLQACRAAPPASVLVRHLAELGDSIETVGHHLAELEQLGISVRAIDGLPVPSADPAVTPAPSSPLADALQTFQTIRQEHQRQAIQRGHARNRAKALPPPGKAPYGYRRGKDRYALDRSAAAVVKDFFEYFLLYGSLSEAVRHLAKKHGKTISVATGHRWLTNPVYRGDLAYKDGCVISNTHVPIISREEAAQVDRLLRRNRRLPPRSASAPRSLAGLVICGECQSPLRIVQVKPHRKKQEYLYLRQSHPCPRQPACSALPYQDVLDRTIQAVCQELPKAVAGLNLPPLAQIKAGVEQTIADKQALLTQLPDLIQEGLFDPETAELRAYKLQAEISALRTKLAQLPPVNLRETVQLVSLPEFWLDLSEAERRFYLREFIRNIQVKRPPQEPWQVEILFIF